MKWLKKFMNSRRLHRTDNTKTLDDKFDPNWEFNVMGSLGKGEKEGVGALYLTIAKEAGYFVAVPRHSPRKKHHLPENNSFISTRSNEGYIGEMIEEGFLIAETVEGGVEVISPSEKMALRMYKRDKQGNTPFKSHITEEDFKKPIKYFVQSLYKN